MVAGYFVSAPLCRGIQPRAIRNDHVDSRQAFAAPVRRLDESDTRIVERQLESSARVLANRHVRDTAPSLGQPGGIGRLQLNRGVRADYFSSFCLAPSASARRLPVALRLALRVPIDLEERAARVRGVQLH